MSSVRVFIASPGDVAEERRLAAGVVNRLAREYADRIDLEVTFWEDEPLLASSDFQSQIGTPADAEILVTLMWGRLGSPLGPQYARADGSRYASATEYEFEEAMASYQATGRPQMLVYRKTAAIDAVGEAAQEQVRAVDEFFARRFLNPDKTAKAAYHQFSEPERFEDALELHLRKLLVDFIPRPNNLPAATTPFIGREKLVAHLADVLLSDGVRLVTLVGPGGTGKTRLGLQVCADLLPRFDDGIFMVSLASLNDPELVPVAIGDELDIRESAQLSVLDNVIQELKRKKMLLFIDNLEQVQAGGKHLSAILAQCPEVKLIVTSREALRLKGAETVRVPPLSVPEAQKLPPLGELVEYEAVRLFVERAKAARSDFELTPDNAESVVGICRKVDALPLAIELAASRIRSMNPDRLLAALDQRFRVLTSGSDDLLDHQRSLRELIAWSYDLLDEREQRLWRTLSIFPDGCSVESAQTVCDPNGEYFIEIDVEPLVDKSLVNIRVERKGGKTDDDSPRLTMLDMLREFAFEQLVASDEFDLLHDRFRDWCIATAEEQKKTGAGALREEWLNRIDEEDNNLRQALERARSGSQPSDLQFAVRLIGALWVYWYDRGIFGEALTWLRWITDSDYRERDSWRAWALAAFAGLLRQQNKLDESAVVAAESLEIYTFIQDDAGRAEALGALGAIAQRQGDADRAQVHLDEALALARGQESSKGRLAFYLNTRGVVDHLRGDIAAAKLNYEESLAIGREINDADDIATALVNLGEIAELHGDASGALDHYRESLRLYGELGLKLAVAYCAEVLAGLELRISEKPSEAAFLFGAADLLREELEAPIEPFNEERLNRDLQQTREVLSTEEFAAAWAAGRGLGMEGVLRHAQSPF